MTDARIPRLFASLTPGTVVAQCTNRKAAFRR